MSQSDPAPAQRYYYRATIQAKHARTGAWLSGKKNLSQVAMYEPNLKAAQAFVQHQLFGSTWWLQEGPLACTQAEARAIWRENGTPDPDDPAAGLTPAPPAHPAEQDRYHEVRYVPGSPALVRFQLLQEELKAQQVPAAHDITLNAPGMPHLPIGTWPTLYCGDADIELATHSYIHWKV
jgi:hypothetical protein